MSIIINKKWHVQMKYYKFVDNIKLQWIRKQYSLMK